MMQVRRSEERGHAKIDWLDSYHSFSFADYYDPKFMGFRALRVINDDRIAGGGGFPTHPHRDMEIITYVIEGALEHRDTLGTQSVIRPGEVQRMTAGTGIRHSEFNPQTDQTTHLLQIWILPDRAGYPPSYEQISFTNRLVVEDLVLVASRAGTGGSVSLHQDVNLYVGKWDSARQVAQPFAKDRYGWLQVVNGLVDVEGQTLKAGDGASFSGQTEITLASEGAAEFLLFDLA
jgi:redox-sensitive bicupin YhaK (pirin superfamily)